MGLIILTATTSVAVLNAKRPKFQSVPEELPVACLSTNLRRF
jgi:hypothetical protein